jgi:DNA-binding response OmpR family regulator
VWHLPEHIPQEGALRQQPEGLALLVDHDSMSRSTVRRLLSERGLALVHARTGLSGLELILRLPETFRLVIVSLDLPGLSGGAVLETLRRFRPGIPLLCLSEKSATLVAPAACLRKSIDEEDLATRMDAALSGTAGFLPLVEVSDEAIARAQARYAVSGNLVEAALEMDRGMSEPGANPF